MPLSNKQRKAIEQVSQKAIQSGKPLLPTTQPKPAPAMRSAQTSSVSLLATP